MREPDSEINGHDEPPKTRPGKSRFALQIVAVFLALVGMAALFGTILGLREGWLVPTWKELSDAQGSIIASLVTLYAAALAAIVGPLIFTGQISNMQAASEHALSTIDKQIQRLAEQLEHIRKVVRQTEEEVVASDTATLFDPGKALLRLEGIREDATALAQEIVERSNKWKSTKDKAKRKWPGRRPYYNLLHNLGFITQVQRDLFFGISDTRLLKQTDVTAEKLKAAEDALERLKANGSTI
jgi:hypothetical protein